MDRIDRFGFVDVFPRSFVLTGRNLPACYLQQLLHPGALFVFNHLPGDGCLHHFGVGIAAIQSERIGNRFLRHLELIGLLCSNREVQEFLNL